MRPSVPPPTVTVPVRVPPVKCGTSPLRGAGRVDFRRRSPDDEDELAPPTLRSTSRRAGRGASAYPHADAMQPDHDDNTTRTWVVRPWACGAAASRPRRPWPGVTEVAAASVQRWRRGDPGRRRHDGQDRQREAMAGQALDG